MVVYLPVKYCKNYSTATLIIFILLLALLTRIYLDIRMISSVRFLPIVLYFCRRRGLFIILQ